MSRSSLRELLNEIPISDDRHPGRAVILTLAICSIVSSVMGLILFLTTGSAMGATFAAGMMLTVGAIERFRAKPVLHYPGWSPGDITNPGAEPSAKEKDGMNFCRDCGKAFQTRRAQNGFDQVSGEPIWNEERGCPDADPTKETNLYKSWYATYMATPSMGSFSSVFGSPSKYQWPMCGKTVTSPMLPLTHAHPEQTSTRCAACIDQMLNDGVIDKGAATKLRAAIR